ncbi:MAG: hypothetical protein R6W73_08315 [Candidatus Saliniplasma sp.]
MNVDDPMSLSTIYQHLSEEDITLENVTEPVQVEDCSDGTCEIENEDVKQIKVTSSRWESLGTIWIWENEDDVIEFRGHSSLKFKHLFDANSFPKSSERCKERVVEVMELGGVQIEEDDVSTSPIGIFESSPICIGMVLLVVFLFILFLVIIFDEMNKKDKEDYSVEKMLSFIAIPALFLIFMHTLRTTGHTEMACYMVWILPLTLVIVAVLFYVPWQYKYGKFLLIGLVGLIIYLVFVTTQNPSSSCFVCFIAIPLVVLIIVFTYLMISDMESE